MTDSRSIDLPNIGKVLFERSYKAKHISITVKPFQGVRVALPKGASFAKAEQVAKDKSKWIKTQQAKIKKIEDKYKEYTENSRYISKATAKGIIIGRLEELARKHGISYNKVFLKNQKTRWGSCSSKKNLSLNYKISLLPPELMDYILLHELLHIKYPNHGRQFWEELSRIVGDAKALDRQLDEYRVLLV